MNIERSGSPPLCALDLHDTSHEDWERPCRQQALRDVSVNRSDLVVGPI
jgi:hypothetical protein